MMANSSRRPSEIVTVQTPVWKSASGDSAAVNAAMRMSAMGRLFASGRGLANVGCRS